MGRTEDDRKALQVLTGGRRRPAVIRLRGWERVAFLAGAVAAVLVAGLSLARTFGASIRHETAGWADAIAGPAVLAALIGIAGSDGPV